MSMYTTLVKKKESIKAAILLYGRIRVAGLEPTSPVPKTGMLTNYTTPQRSGTAQSPVSTLLKGQTRTTLHARFD